MTANYYDAIIVGADLAPMLCAALLSRRGFRVLLIGHDAPPADYEVLDVKLPRAPFTLPNAQSPIIRRVLSDLSIHQELRRRATAVDPALQVILPKARLDFAVNQADLERELEREFPEVRRPIENLYRQLDEAMTAIDHFVDRDLVLPPGGFFERRAFARAAAGLPFDKNGSGPDPLRHFPEEHPLRVVTRLPSLFGDGIVGSPSALRFLRHFGGWTRSPAVVDGGLGTLHHLVLQTLATHNGDLALRERGEKILVKGSQTCGIRLAGSGEEVGSEVVIAGCNVAALTDLLPGRDTLAPVFERFGEPQPKLARRTVNVVIEADGIPEAMARDVFLVPRLDRPERADPDDGPLRIQALSADAAGRRVLCIETLVPWHKAQDPAGVAEQARQRVLDRIATLMPFVRRHAVLIDSPHDGLPPRDLKTGATVKLDTPSGRGPSTMELLHSYPVLSGLGLCGLPIRTPLRRLLLCGTHNVPGLGFEGAFLAAWSTARVVEKIDRRRARLRKRSWTQAPR